MHHFFGMRALLGSIWELFNQFWSLPSLPPHVQQGLNRSTNKYPIFMSLQFVPLTLPYAKINDEHNYNRNYVQLTRNCNMHLIGFFFFLFGKVLGGGGGKCWILLFPLHTSSHNVPI